MQRVVINYHSRPPIVVNVLSWGPRRATRDSVGGLLIETKCLGNRVAGLRYWVAGPDVYRYLRAWGLPFLGDILSPFAFPFTLLLCFMV